MILMACLFGQRQMWSLKTAPKCADAQGGIQHVVVRCAYIDQHVASSNAPIVEVFGLFWAT